MLKIRILSNLIMEISLSYKSKIEVTQKILPVVQLEIIQKFINGIELMQIQETQNGTTFLNQCKV